MLEQLFITGELPATIVKGDYIPFLVLLSYAVAVLGSFTGLTLAARMMGAQHYNEKRKLHWAGAVSLGSGIWSMHFIGMLAYDTKMLHQYDPLLTAFSGLIGITVAWFVLHIAQAGTLSWKRLGISSVLLGFGIAAMHYMGMEAMQMRASLYYRRDLFIISILIAIAASGAALWIILTLGQRISHNQMKWRMIAALVMGIAICGMHYTGMASAVIIPFADCRFGITQSFSMLEISILAVTGLICGISLMLGVANRPAILLAFAAVFSLPLVTIVYQAVSGLNEDIRFTQREQQGVVYHRELIDLLLSLQKIRSSTYVAQNSLSTDERELATQRKNVNGWIAKVDAVDDKYGEHLGVHQQWLSAKAQFGDLLEQHALHQHENAEFEFAKHTVIIHDFMAFMDKVVDKSNLNTDPEPDSNLVADVLYNLMPQIADTLEQMRGLASGYLILDPHHTKKWTDADVARLQSLYSQLVMLDGLMENRLNRSAHIVPNAQRFVDYYATEIKPALDIFEQRYEQMVFNRKTEWSPQILFIDAEEIIQAYDALYDDMTASFSVTLEHRLTDNNLKKNLVLLSSMVGLCGFVALFIFLFRSLTTTERAEKDARHARKAAEQAAAAKSDFLANMSHELRTPMNGVLGMAQLLADTDLTEEQKQYVSTINGSGENLLMLLNDILDFSKIEAGALTLENIAYPIKEAVTGAVNLLHPQADKKGIDLHMECEPDVPDYIWGDAGRMRQIIINLAGNAIKFTESGYVRILMRMQARDDGNYLHVSVEDTGMGIPADKVGKIFDKFTQADASVTRKFGGTGLGLAITKQLVALMGGHIGVESVEGKGSTFWFVIPCISAQSSDLLATKETMQTIVQNNTVKIPASEAKVLLVEDYPVNQVFAEKLLRKFGFEHIDVAEDGTVALDKFHENKYDIVFMDCQMPKLDGYITTQEIRMIESATNSYTPVVAMTANAMMGDREKCLASGMDDYLSKPLRAVHLRKVLESYFLLDADKKVITKAPGPKAAEESPVDMSQLRVFTDGDPEEEKALITLFMDQAHAMIDVLRQSTHEAEKEAWKSAAHRFKGSSGNLGAMKLHHLCRRAEMNFDDIEQKKLEMLAAIKSETARVAQFFNAA